MVGFCLVWWDWVVGLLDFFFGCVVVVFSTCVELLVGGGCFMVVGVGGSLGSVVLGCLVFRGLLGGWLRGCVFFRG